MSVVLPASGWEMMANGASAARLRRSGRGHGGRPGRSVTGGAAAEQVESVVVGREARGTGHLLHEGLERAFEPIGRREVGHRTAGGADQVVMVVVGEVFGQLEAGELVGSGDAVTTPQASSTARFR